MSAKLSLVTFLVLASLLLGAGSATMLLLPANSTERDREAEQLLRTHVLFFEDALASQLEGAEPRAVQARVRRVGRATGIRFTMIRADGTVLADSEGDPARMDNHGTRSEVLAALESDFAVARRVSKTVNAELLYVARAVRRDGALVGWIRASAPPSVFARGPVPRSELVVGSACFFGTCALLWAVLTIRAWIRRGGATSGSPRPGHRDGASGSR